MSITTALAAVVMLLLLSVSCGGDKKEVVAVEFNPDETYTMRTTDMISLISDSGVTRYRMTSPEVLIFDQAAEPYWYFPQGLYVEKFDSLFATEASIQADTAYFWNKKELWKAIGNVEVENLQGERFETDSLYWDMDKKIVYSDAFMRITRADRVITGIGFESNQDMSDYRIYHPQGSFPVGEESRDTTTVQPAEQPSAPAPVAFPPVRRERPQRRIAPQSAAVDTTEIPSPDLQ